MNDWVLKKIPVSFDHARSVQASSDMAIESTKEEANEWDGGARRINGEDILHSRQRIFTFLGKDPMDRVTAVLSQSIITTLVASAVFTHER